MKEEKTIQEKVCEEMLRGIECEVHGIYAVLGKFIENYRHGRLDVATMMEYIEGAAEASNKMLEAAKVMSGVYMMLGVKNGDIVKPILDSVDIVVMEGKSKRVVEAGISFEDAVSKVKKGLAATSAMLSVIGVSKLPIAMIVEYYENPANPTIHTYNPSTDEFSSHKEHQVN